MEAALSAIQNTCPPQDAQQLKTACAALEIETGIIDNTAAGELPVIATNLPVLIAPMSGFCDPAQRPL